MDIAYAIEGLVPAAEYEGSVTANTYDAFSAIVWKDARPKPTWEALNNYWNSSERITKSAIQNFSFKLLWGEIWSDALGVISNTGKVELPPYAKTIEDIWNYPNRAGVYSYMQMLVAAGKGSSDDLTIIVAAFAVQGINLITIT